MGRAFKAPAMGADDAWRLVQALYAYGFRFDGYGSSDGTAALPRRASEVEAFAAEHPVHPDRTGPFDGELLP